MVVCLLKISNLFKKCLNGLLGIRCKRARIQKLTKLRYRLINNKDINDILEKEIRVKNEEDIYVLNIIVLECENWNDDKISLCESSDCILYFCKGYNEEIEKIKNIRSTIKSEHISHKIMAMDPPELPEDPEMRAFALIYGNMYPCTGLIPLDEEKGVYKGEHIEGFSESGCWHSSTGPSFPQSYYLNYISDLILEKTKSTSSQNIKLKLE